MCHIFRWNPLHRITPEEALKHVWLSGHANHVASMINLSSSNNTVNSNGHSIQLKGDANRKATAKSIQTLTVRETETGESNKFMPD